MLRRSLVFAGVLLAGLMLATPALGVRVHIRVEAPRATIFGPSEPLVRPVTGTFSPPDGPGQTLAAPTPLGALERASRKGEFYYRVQEFAFGAFVDRIGRREAAGASGWVFKVNGVLPPVGADAYVLAPGDRVLWYFARFDPVTGEGPPTLDLARRARGCYVALSVDDQGKRTRARKVVFRLDGRRVLRRSGRICPRAHWHVLRATKRGAVRSEVLLAPLRAIAPEGARLTGSR